MLYIGLHMQCECVQEQISTLVTQYITIMSTLGGIRRGTHTELKQGQCVQKHKLQFLLMPH